MNETRTAELKTFFEECREDQRYSLVQMSDRLLFDRWQNIQQECSENAEKIMDLRLFDENGEVHLFRRKKLPAGTLGCRIIDESAEKPDEESYFDETQYLDIDTKRSASEKQQADGRDVYATGGGRYHLPYSGMNDVKIRVRNYVGYYENSGDAYISDWRLAGLEQ